MRVGSSSRDFQRFLQCLPPQRTLGEFQSKYKTLKKRHWPRLVPGIDPDELS